MKYLLTGGTLLIALGFLFSLQGLGIIGPNSSFMFTNAAWIINGAIISIVGVILSSMGVLVHFKKRK